MSTNFYLVPANAAFFEPSAGLHIGLSSMGWAFQLRIHPESGIHEIDGWRKLFSDPLRVIMDEYGTVIDKNDMQFMITRGSPTYRPNDNGTKRRYGHWCSETKMLYLDDAPRGRCGCYNLVDWEFT